MRVVNELLLSSKAHKRRVTLTRIEFVQGFNTRNALDASPFLVMPANRGSAASCLRIQQLSFWRPLPISQLFERQCSKGSMPQNSYAHRKMGKGSCQSPGMPGSYSTTRSRVKLLESMQPCLPILLLLLAHSRFICPGFDRRCQLMKHGSQKSLGPEWISQMQGQGLQAIRAGMY